MKNEKKNIFVLNSGDNRGPGMKKACGAETLQDCSPCRELKKNGSNIVDFENLRLISLVRKNMDRPLQASLEADDAVLEKTMENLLPFII